MPTNRRRLPRSAAQPEVPDWHRQLLIDGNWKAAADAGGLDAFLTRLEDHRRAWARIGAELVAEYRKKNSGCRPWAWWIFDAPEPRRMIGGSGKPRVFEKDFLGAVTFGIPRCILGEKPKKPARFESQAEFLQRHGLLTAAEKRAIHGNKEKNRQKAPEAGRNRKATQKGDRRNPDSRGGETCPAAGHPRTKTKPRPANSLGFERDR